MLRLKERIFRNPWKISSHRTSSHTTCRRYSELLLNSVTMFANNSEIFLNIDRVSIGQQMAVEVIT